MGKGSKDRLKGLGNKIKGSAEDAAGKATNDPDLQAKGKFDKVKGTAQETKGKLKDT
ncbi:hypothetical protein JCM19037_4132 [Geomicrobium sp. JCM 19037]|uniref:CsbD family protein n=1 Tax=unclassified Geomicrobium TaxID=2628951 RepID=UPI00045F4C11|nr:MULTISPECIES: CsbD family protein [unclassified Geomicrobium]GAK05621.1 hypothetical protein JCM19037_4132 [Geomicrobium sp. JCM 19037]GAK14428.1 hypothetical protein JCM19039_4346 [Geomicrobium sp. JCM 19039]